MLLFLLIRYLCLSLLSLDQYFKPEFINRIDEIVVFKKLSKEVLYEVLDKIINEVDQRLIDLNIKINLTQKAKDYFIMLELMKLLVSRDKKNFREDNWF